jgi:NADH:ubiquinone oxidoreductase subunit D
MARISAHLLGLGAFAMDVGAMTVFLYTFTEREKLYNLIELLTGARFTTSYTRIGGQTRDLPDGFLAALNKFLEEFVPQLDEVDRLLTRNPIFVNRTKESPDRTFEVAGLIMMSAKQSRTLTTKSMTLIYRSALWVMHSIVILFASKKCDKASRFCIKR